MNRSLIRLCCSTFLLLLSISAAAESPAPASAPDAYKIVKEFKVGGEGRWDYLTCDAAGRRLFVTRANRVDVMNADTGERIGEIPNTPGVHGVAIALPIDRGFTSNGRAGTITVFDTGSLKVLGSVKAGENPDAIIYDPASRRAFAFNGKSGNVTVVDGTATPPVSDTPTALALGGKPEFAVADGAGHVFVNIEDKNEVVAIDSRELKVIAHWPIAPGDEPSAMTMDRATNRLFIGCGNKMMVVMDAQSGHVVTSFPIGAGVDAADFDPQTHLIFASCGEGTLAMAEESGPNEFHALPSVQTQKGARTMALDPQTHRVFLVTADFGPAPAATADAPHPRPALVPGTFRILVVGRD